MMGVAMGVTNDLTAPHSCRYQTMQANIATKYVEIEKQLVNKFREALPAADVKRMKLYASTLKPFLKVCLKWVWSKSIIGHFWPGESVCVLCVGGHGLEVKAID